MLHFKGLTLISLLVLINFCVSEDVDITEDCIRCLCHARTSCFRLKNCAKYSINQAYWETAGRPTFLDDSPNDRDAYKNCVNDDGCIMRTIVGYIKALGKPDCNCDFQITCKDFLAAHLHGDSCNKNIDRNQLSRFDKCTSDRKIPNSIGWTISQSCVPNPSQSVTPIDEFPGPV